jgi:hypothetical protein
MSSMNRLSRFAMLARVAIAASLTLLPSFSRADIAGLAESDARVEVYRQLERLALESDEGKRLFADLRVSPCHSSDPEPFRILKMDATDPVRVESGEKVTEYELAAQCAIDISTGCQDEIFLFPIGSDGRWTWTLSRIAYVSYMRRLAARSGVPPSVIGPQLAQMEKKILANIDRRLKRPVKPQQFTGESGQMGVANDLGIPANDMSTLEETIARRWNTYVSTLPKATRRTLPAMNYELGCGAGEIVINVKLHPAEGQLWLISEFDWRLCRARGEDPWDRNACAGWSKLVGQHLSLSGRYKFSVDWPTGKTTTATIDLTNLADKTIDIRHGTP